jgi:hypothetical protein
MAKYVVRYPRKLMQDYFGEPRYGIEGNARATSNRSGMSEACFRCCSKGHRARYLDCPRQIARTIDAHRPGIWHLDSNQLRAARESSRVICQLTFDVLANACTPVEFALREVLLTRY